MRQIGVAKVAGYVEDTQQELIRNPWSWCLQVQLVLEPAAAT